MNFICDCEEGFIYKPGERCPYCGVTYTGQTKLIKKWKRAHRKKGKK